MKTYTVKEVMEALSKLPQDLPCFVRPKYHGDIKYFEDVPVNANSICEMHPKRGIYPDAVDHVCFLL